MHWTTDPSRGYLESITDKRIPHMRLGEKDPLSEGDIKKINKAYPCERIASNKPEDECTIKLSPKNTKEKLPERCMKQVGQKIKIIGDTSDDKQIKNLTINCKVNKDKVATEEDEPANNNTQTDTQTTTSTQTTVSTNTQQPAAKNSSRQPDANNSSQQAPSKQAKPAAKCDREFKSKQLNDVCIPLSGVFESKNLIKRSSCGLKVEGEHTLNKLS